MNGGSCAHDGLTISAAQPPSITRACAGAARPDLSVPQDGGFLYTRTSPWCKEHAGTSYTRTRGMREAWARTCTAPLHTGRGHARRPYTLRVLCTPLHAPARLCTPLHASACLCKGMQRVVHEDTGMSRATVQRSLRKLEEAGFLSCHKRVKGSLQTSNLYKLKGKAAAASL